MQAAVEQYEYNASEWIDTAEGESGDSQNHSKQSRKQSKRERQDNRRQQRTLKRGDWE